MFIYTSRVTYQVTHYNQFSTLIYNIIQIIVHFTWRSFSALIKSSAIQCHVTGWMDANIWKVLQSFKTSQTTHPITQQHIPEDLNHQQHCC